LGKNKVLKKRCKCRSKLFRSALKKRKRERVKKNDRERKEREEGEREKERKGKREKERDRREKAELTLNTKKPQNNVNIFFSFYKENFLSKFLKFCFSCFVFPCFRRRKEASIRYCPAILLLLDSTSFSGKKVKKRRLFLAKKFLSTFLAGKFC
jgi:hypothetical protein